MEEFGDLEIAGYAKSPDTRNRRLREIAGYAKSPDTRNRRIREIAGYEKYEEWAKCGGLQSAPLEAEPGENMKRIWGWIAGKIAARQARRKRWVYRSRVWTVNRELGLAAFSLADQVIFEAARTAPKGIGTLDQVIGILDERRIAEILSYIITSEHMYPHLDAKPAFPTARSGGARRTIADELVDFPAEWALEALQAFFFLNPKFSTYLVTGWMGLQKG